MKKLLVSLVFALPLSAQADFMDVIEGELNEGCSFSKYMEIVSDFNEWAKDWNYKAEILVPLHSQNLTSFYWLGRSPDAETFGKAWDSWRDSLADADSVPAKLNARFVECNISLSRESYDVY